MAEDLARTPLHDEHVRLGGKMVPFAGFSMPVQYPSGITAEHQTVRERAGLFDVSHMGEFIVTGPDSIPLLQSVAVNDLGRIVDGQAQYSALCNEAGCVLDDLLVYRYGPERFMVVVNASNRAKDWEWLTARSDGFDVELSDRSDEVGLIAFQGPASSEILSRVTDLDLDAIGYYRFAEGEVAGVAGTVARTGYTGEDGFELYVEAADAPALWRALLDAGEGEGIGPAGLGARDSLRLEMGYALYGNDLDEEHTALESGLGWIVRLDKGSFVGREALARQKEAGVSRRLVGFRLLERGFPRPGYPIVSAGEEVGSVTSGTASPSLQVGLGMGYVPAGLATPGSEISIRIRGRDLAARVERPPFYQSGSIRR